MTVPRHRRAQSTSPRRWRKPTERVRDHLDVRRALSSQVISLAQLVGRPIRDPQGTMVSRVSDVVVRWATRLEPGLAAALMICIDLYISLVSPCGGSLGRQASPKPNHESRAGTSASCFRTRHIPRMRDVTGGGDT